MSKQSIQSKFKMGNELYTLVYFPDKNDVTQVEPNYSLMEPLASGIDEVIFPSGNGSQVKKHMAWFRASIPANKNTMTPQKNFLLFALTDLPTNPQHITPNSMVCYAVQDVSVQEGMGPQNFVNHLFNIKNEEAPLNGAKIHDQEWASNMFNVLKEEDTQEDISEGTAYANTVTTKEDE